METKAIFDCRYCQSSSGHQLSEITSDTRCNHCAHQPLEEPVRFSGGPFLLNGDLYAELINNGSAS